MPSALSCPLGLMLGPIITDLNAINIGNIYQRTCLKKDIFLSLRLAESRGLSDENISDACLVVQSTAFACFERLGLWRSCSWCHQHCYTNSTLLVSITGVAVPALWAFSYSPCRGNYVEDWTMPCSLLPPRQPSGSRLPFYFSTPCKHWLTFVRWTTHAFTSPRQAGRRGRWVLRSRCCRREFSEVLKAPSPSGWRLQT